MAAVRKPFHSTTNHTILFGPVSSQGKGTESQEYYCWLRNAAEGGLPNGLTSQGTFAWEDQDHLASNGDCGGCENLEHPYMRPRIREDLLPHDFSRWRNTADCSVSPRAAFNQERDGFFHQSSLVQSSSSEPSGQLHSSSPSVGSPSLKSRFAEVFKKFHSPNSPVASAEQGRTCQSRALSRSCSQPAGSSGEIVSSVEETRATVEVGACSEAEEEADSPSMAAVRGRGGGVDQALYQNLVEMIPLMETFMDQQGSRSSFLHRASLVYTPAPPRDPQPRKAIESPSRVMKAQPLRRASVINKHVDGRETSPRWEESENILRRVDTDGPDETTAGYGNAYQFAGDFADRSEMFFLRNQIDDLKRQLVEKDNLLQFAQQAQQQVQQAIHDAANQADMRRLQATIDELQRELWEKDHIALTSQSQLANKQEHIAEMQSLLERLEASYHAQTNKASKVEEELNGLRCQVAALRFQLEAAHEDGSRTLQTSVSSENGIGEDKASAVSTTGDLSFDQKTEQSRSQLVLSRSYPGDTEYDASAAYEQDYKDMELVRRQYLAAIIAAREHPGDEALALVAEFRTQLQAFLTRPSFLCKDSDTAAAEETRFNAVLRSC